MKLTKKKAIELSILKWEDIRSRPMEMEPYSISSYNFEKYAFKGCPLCVWTGIQCNKCPLQKVWGKHCDGMFTDEDGNDGFWIGWGDTKKERISMCDIILEALRKCK